MRSVAALTLAGAGIATLGGLVFWAAHGQTPLTRSLAYGFWLVAATCLLLLFATSQKHVWRALPTAAYEGWVFTVAAAVLTVVGAIIDTVGAG